jgi:hypothetical protein
MRKELYSLILASIDIFFYVDDPTFRVDSLEKSHNSPARGHGVESAECYFRPSLAGILTCCSATGLLLLRRPSVKGVNC